MLGEVGSCFYSRISFLILDWDTRGKWKADQNHLSSLLLRIRVLRTKTLYTSEICELASDWIWWTMIVKSRV